MVIFSSFLGGMVVGIIAYHFLSARGSRQNKATTSEGIPKPIYEKLEQNYKQLEQEFTHKIEELGKLKGEMDTIKNYNAKQKIEFENITKKIIKEEKEELINYNKSSLDHILNPFKHKIAEFQNKVDFYYKNESEQRISLTKEIEMIAKTNKTLTDQANSLTEALRGNKKEQGNWGEVQLETLLQTCGLKHNIHYKKQLGLKNNEGDRLIPDFIILLPDDKEIIIDSKVSLVNYEQYVHAEDPNLKKATLLSHIKNLSDHINALSSKNYSQLEGINSIDYVIMFVPIEPALSTAIEVKQGILEYALERNIILASTITLFPILKTVHFLWKQDTQNRNAKVIATKAGEMHDKFVAFYEDLKNIGKHLQKAQDVFHESKKKLSDSPKPSTTLIYKAKELKELGINNKEELTE